MPNARPFRNFPTSWGNIRTSVVGHAGPVLYTVGTFNTIPITGGDTVYASEFGLKFLVGVIPLGMSDLGTYFVKAVPITDSDVGNVAGTSYKLIWYVQATGVEAAAIDLSGQTVRLLGIGFPN